MYDKEIRDKFNRIAAHLDEKSRRLWCANEALAVGWGGVTLVAKSTGVSRTTITTGIQELTGSKAVPEDRIRRGGGGRKKTQENPALLDALEVLVEPISRGDPESHLRWVSKSSRKLARTLQRQGYPISHTNVASLLNELDYSLQANKKRDEGAKANPDRDAQFTYIHQKIQRFQQQQQPVLSVDAKKKETVGNYKNPGREYRPQGQPREVKAYDFPGESGKVAPYGIYDVTANTGWVNVGVSHDTAELAVNSLRLWWDDIGKHSYPHARKMLLPADGGGSNGYRVRLWKYELQQLVNERGREIHICHYPPGTSKWNKIEHRMFSFISKNWQGHPLVDHVTIISLLCHTTTEEGLTITARLDNNIYNTGKKVSDEEWALINIDNYVFHGEWNYKIRPQK